MSQFVWIGGSGCLLPSLIIFNLLFGKLIFGSIRLWLGIEVILIFVFIISINTMVRLISRQFGQQGHKPKGDGSASFSRSHKPQGGVIDIQGHVVEDDKRLK